MDRLGISFAPAPPRNAWLFLGIDEGEVAEGGLVNCWNSLVAALESAAHSVTKLEEKEFVVLTELLMLQLLKLDGVVAEGEAKMYRWVEVSA
ncbi:hypothetical protein Syun_009892 [Stephania yunnanensis]|uniref:BAG domain-containing protein n=1 Tax=Stephania yunnanensis TaxID=152371 RepID=A0AAP0PP35_9MAGN